MCEPVGPTLQKKPAWDAGKVWFTHEERNTEKQILITEFTGGRFDVRPNKPLELL